MLANFAPIILFALIFSLGFSVTQRMFRLQGLWRWILAYTLGMALSGLGSYFLWLLGVPWNLIIILLTTISVFSLYDLFSSVRQISSRQLIAEAKAQAVSLTELEPLETLLLAVIAFSAVIVVAWHFFLQPVTWDTLVLYDYRARAISDGWQVEQFFLQFRYEDRILYDFLHPYLSSIWQALALSFGGSNSTFLYLGLMASVLAHAAYVLPSRKTWIVFATLLLATPSLLTVWTQNYAVEPYFLLWLHLAFFVFAPFNKRPQNSEAMTVLFLICTMLLRVSEPYWLAFLLWLSWPVVRSQKTGAEKLLQLALYWLPPLAIFAQWGQLQEEAKTWIQVGSNHIISTYDPARYGSVGQNLLRPEYWLRWFSGVTWKNPLVPFLLLALGYSFLHKKNPLKDRAFWLFLVFVGMLFAAFSVDLAADWKNWELKTELWPRTGLPLVAVAVVLTALKTQPVENRQPRLPGRKRG